MASPANNGYLSGLSSFSPWGSKTATPKAMAATEPDTTVPPIPPLQQQGRNTDHTINRRHRLSLRNYPRDCPPLQVQWYHAVDIPKRKPNPSNVHEPSKPAVEKPAATPKKYVSFSGADSRAIEAAFQELAEEDDGAAREKLLKGAEQKPEGSLGGPEEDREVQEHGGSKTLKVPVNEDYLFDVDIEQRELLPAYWLGPVYDVRRGTWFYQEGVNLRPCDENLATQLEEGYLKVKAWTFDKPAKIPAPTSNPRPRPVSMYQEKTDSSLSGSSKVVTPKSSADNLKALQQDTSPTAGQQQKAFRLFGNHMNSVVTYQDATTAWLVNDDFLMKMSSTLYERFAGGGHFAGIKLRRGFTDLKKVEVKDKKPIITDSPKQGPLARSDDIPTGKDKKEGSPTPMDPLEGRVSESETFRRSLQRQMSSLIESGVAEDRAAQDEEERRRDEKEMLDDYKDQDENEQGREIEHLILVTHGIGQRLGLRLESVNFVHDVNTLRKTLKAVYGESETLQALNDEVRKPVKNSRVQVLPICWRHLLDFPKQSLKHNRKEHDLGDIDFEDDDYPKLEDITNEGVPAVRNLITDLGLDILLYHSPAYKGHITRIVLEECNRIYKLFMQRNPNFNGKISLIGHSLGSAIMFDILCNQRVDVPGYRGKSARNDTKDHHGLHLDFEVEDFYAVGSPIGLFQMLKGRRLAGRQTPQLKAAQTPFGVPDDPFQDSASTSRSAANSKASAYVEITTSSPKCSQVFNIFHPADPIAYRIEPLISPAMAALKPQPLPYTKRGIFTAPVGQGFTGIGARVGQSVSGFWSSISSGIASSLLNRSLGLTDEAASRLAGQQQQQLAKGAAGASATGTTTVTNTSTTAPGNPSQQPSLPTVTPTSLASPPDSHPSNLSAQDPLRPPILTSNASTQSLETLYSGYKKRRLSAASDEGGAATDLAAAVREIEEQARRLKKEEKKVRMLNRTGRVDFSVQEGAFDISLLASIASHLSYWADEDVSHFILSQLLMSKLPRGISAAEAIANAVPDDLREGQLKT